MSRTDQGSGVGLAEWRAAGRVLRERAEMTLALGRCLEQLPVGPGLTPEGLAERLQAVIGEVLAQGGRQKEAPAARAMACGRGMAGAARTVAAKEEREPGAALRALRADLFGQRWPVVWFASAGTDAERVTLALGVRVEGTKQIVGLWSGGSGEQRLGQTAAEDLWLRGMNRGTPWVAVTGAERALGAALLQQWGARLVLVHDRRAVADAVVAHLPAAAREAAVEGLREAWATPEFAKAQALLERQAECWKGSFPGAEARLRQEIDATTSVQALGVGGALGERLRTATPAAYLLGQCLPAGRGLLGRAHLGAIAGELLRRQAGFRRLTEHGQLPGLCQRLDARGASVQLAG